MAVVYQMQHVLYQIVIITVKTVTQGTTKSGCYREVTCWYRLKYMLYTPFGLCHLAVIERRPAYTVTVIYRFHHTTMQYAPHVSILLCYKCLYEHSQLLQLFDLKIVIVAEFVRYCLTLPTGYILNFYYSFWKTSCQFFSHRSNNLTC